MSLQPFMTTYAATVAGWPTSSREVAMWCGRQEFPLPAQAEWNAAQPVDYTWLRHR
ncbi:hypothetical protein [Streptosporangium amethystogenes]|uniref:hypothetical protein n=1 Tax=Streptosporangium amethystogenes TaxID=2002 RepID=UPI0012F92AB4|nr:hypothetical protein [Streptosporangium amethystogenes]